MSVQESSILVTQEKWNELESQVATYSGFALREWYPSKQAAHYLKIDQGLFQELMSEGRVHFRVLNGDHVVHSGYWIAENLLYGMHYTCIGLKRKYLSAQDSVIEDAPHSPEMESRLKARVPSDGEVKMVADRILKEALASGALQKAKTDDEVRSLAARMLLEHLDRLNIQPKNPGNLERIMRGEKELEKVPARLVPERPASLSSMAVEPEVKPAQKPQEYRPRMFNAANRTHLFTEEEKKEVRYCLKRRRFW